MSSAQKDSNWMSSAAQMSSAVQEDSSAQMSSSERMSSDEKDSAQMSSKRTEWRARSSGDVLSITVPLSTYRAITNLLDAAQEQVATLPHIQRGARMAQIGITRSIVKLLGDGGIPLNQVRAAMRALTIAAHTNILEAEQLQQLTTEFAV